MKMTLLLFGTMIAAITQGRPPQEHDRIIVHTLLLNCSLQKAFEMFSDNSQLEGWLTAKANVEPRLGGLYELFWEPQDPENNSTIGCRILALEEPYYLNFEWKGPKQYKHFMNVVKPLTNVTVTFTPVGDKTKVVLIHTGWRDGSEWEEARVWFERGWGESLSKLEKKVNELP